MAGWTNELLDGWLNESMYGRKDDWVDDKWACMDKWKTDYRLIDISAGIYHFNFVMISRVNTHVEGNLRWGDLCTFRGIWRHIRCSVRPVWRRPTTNPRTHSSTSATSPSTPRNYEASCLKWGKSAPGASSCIRAFSAEGRRGEGEEILQR